MADNGVAGARTRSSEVVLSPGVRPGVFRGPWRAVLRYAGSCLVFKYQFVASDPSIAASGTRTQIARARGPSFFTLRRMRVQSQQIEAAARSVLTSAVTYRSSRRVVARSAACRLP